jgi:hypothetical protein
VMFASTNRNSIKEPLFLLFISIPRGVWIQRLKFRKCHMGMSYRVFGY